MLERLEQLISKENVDKIQTKKIAIVGLGVSFYAASSIEPVTKIESEATSMVVDNVPVEHVQEEVSL